MVEINKLIGKGMIEYSGHEKGEFISPIFLRSKSDGTSKLILIRKILNKFLEYNHFKMETTHSVADLIQPHCYMVIIDFENDYYSVKISEEDSKYLKFYSGKFFWNLLCYQIDCLQVHDRWQSSYLGIVGIIVATDDIIVLGENYKEYIIGAIKTIKLFLKLGFIIHPE